MAYNRFQAVQYAALWWSSHNPQFAYFGENDCTNFISQCLYAGGIPMEHTGNRSTGWWYRGPNEQWSFSWAVVPSFRNYLLNSGRAEERSEARQLELGDVITYDFRGSGTWNHAVIVVGFDRDGEPLVAAHSYDSWGRPWPYTDSPAYTPQAKYSFLHITL